MSNAATFIIPGNLPHLARIAAYLNDDVCGILLHQRIPVSEARAARVCAEQFADRLYTLEDLRALTGDVLAESDWEGYERCLQAVLADQRVHYLAMRSYFNSAFNNAVAIEKIVVNSMRIIRRTRPVRLVSSSTPHSVEAWVFATCCEQMGIPVFILERTPINNRAWVYAGMDQQRVVPRADAATNVAVSAYSQQQVREQQQAKPGERDRHGFYVSRMDLSSVKGAESNRWWSYRRELPQLFAGRLLTVPLRLASLYLKRRLYASYRKIATKTLPSGPFVIFFMHYQPERSSLPEGLHFVQQWLAIRLLAWMLPPGWTVLVREHPTMWLQPLDVTVRTPDLFTELASLPRTQICSMDVDTFELIDRAAVVATLTGSVGFQALLRGKPVLAFGLPAYKDHPACFSVRSAQDLLAGLREIQRGDLSERFAMQALTRYLLWVERNSVVADLQESDWLEARLKNFSELYRQLFAGELVL